LSNSCTPVDVVVGAEAHGEERGKVEGPRSG
jgi:hypothetical protein